MFKACSIFPHNYQILSNVIKKKEKLTIFTCVTTTRTRPIHMLYMLNNLERQKDRQICHHNTEQTIPKEITWPWIIQKCIAGIQFSLLFHSSTSDKCGQHLTTFLH